MSCILHMNMTHLIKYVMWGPFWVNGLTRNPPVYYLCYMYEIDTKIKYVIQIYLFHVIFRSYCCIM